MTETKKVVMTHIEAHKEASNRWGADAWVGEGRAGLPDDRRMMKLVGVNKVNPNNSMLVVFGFGYTWKDAFENATKSGH